MCFRNFLFLSKIRELKICYHCFLAHIVLKKKNCSDHLSVQSTQTIFKSTVKNLVEITFVVFLI